MDKPDVTSPGESIRGPKEKNSPSVRKCHPGEYIKKICLGRVFLVVKPRVHREWMEVFVVGPQDVSEAGVLVSNFIAVGPGNATVTLFDVGVCNGQIPSSCVI